MGFGSSSPPPPQAAAAPTTVPLRPLTEVAPQAQGARSFMDAGAAQAAGLATLDPSQQQNQSTILGSS